MNSKCSEIKVLVFCWLLAIGQATLLHAAQEKSSGAGATVLFGDRTARLDKVLIEGDSLAVPVEQFSEVTGLELKPEGVCQGELCIPLTPEARRAVLRNRDGREWIFLTALAERLGQVVEAVPAERVWSFGEVPATVATGLESGMAPDFALPDRTSKLVRLSDFRGKKVLLLTWASW